MKRHVDQVRARLSNTVPSQDPEGKLELSVDMKDNAVDPLPTACAALDGPPSNELNHQPSPEVQVPPDPSETAEVQRSGRERRPPAHLQDFVR